MRPETNELLSRLKIADWTAHVGENVPEAKCVSAMEAIEMAGSDQCEDLYLHEQNLLSAAVFDHSCSVQQWNSVITDERRQEIIALVDEKFPPHGPLGEVPHDAKAGIQWLIAHALIESEFADAHDRRFFRDTVEWLIRGHFICNWCGDFWPKGRAVIY